MRFAPIPLLLLILSPPSHASVYGPSPHPALSSLVAEAEALLPSALQKIGPVPIRLARLDPNPAPESSRRVARYRNGAIELHEGFVDSVATEKGRQLALRSLIHETAHAWDFSPIHLTPADQEETRL
ncbi:MAG: hypothetical protein HUU37_05120, partial [Bdellovibrionales bacterium]|nr:hypothetical protein [Bdellovibrionales bacterium]